VLCMRLQWKKGAGESGGNNATGYRVYELRWIQVVLSKKQLLDLGGASVCVDDGEVDECVGWDETRSALCNEKR
jgi:hypothetical protein